MKTTRIWTAIFAATLALGLTGCGGSGSNSSLLPNPLVRFVNASPDSGQLQFLMNDVARSAPLTYLASSDDFASVPFITDDEGGYDFSVNDVGSGNELERDNTSIGRDTASIIISYGLTNPGLDDEKKVQQAIATVDRVTPIGNKARLVIFNAAVQPTGTEPLSIDFQTVDLTDPLSQGTPQFSKPNLTYGAYSETASVLLIDSGSKTLQARLSSDGAGSTVVVVAQDTFNLIPGKIYLALVSGVVDSVIPGQAPKISLIEIRNK